MTKKGKIIIYITMHICLIIIYTCTIKAYAQENESLKVYRKQNEEGYSQIVYEKNGIEYQITNEKFTHASPVTNGVNIVWSTQINSLWQIYHHNIATNYTMKITNTGNNVNPQFYENYLLWEGQKNGVWQVYLFDGMVIRQLTSGNLPAQNPTINDNYVSYSKKSSDGKWYIYLYNIETRKTEIANNEIPGIKPTLEDDKLFWQGEDPETQEEYFYTFDLENKSSYYEGDKTQRRNLLSLNQRRLKAIDMARKVERDTEVTPKKIGLIPDIFRNKDTSFFDTQEISLRDIKTELGIGELEKIRETNDTLESDITTETTQSTKSQ